ncbi:DNA damage-regulated autophagy modulator protein 2-like isoform X2 [Homarus americanus]|nr:DNA damage-regulated autophagy modulator protein 2-like isoform X2 [Homarus americanus]
MNNHVEPDFPYISSTGDDPPESCFFTQMLNIMALLLGFTVYVRHRLIVDYCAKNITRKNVMSRSKISMFFGFAASFGISIVGSFQSKNLGSIHLLGASLAFGVGNIYLWIQSVLSYSLVPWVNSLGVCRVRVATSLLATLMNITTVLFSVLHALANDNQVAYLTRNQEWKNTRISWEYHVVATASEWVLAGCFCVILFTFAPEFKRVTIQGVLIELERDRRQVREAVRPQSSICIVENSRL